MNVIIQCAIYVYKHDKFLFSLFIENFATEQLNQEQGVNSEISGLSESALSSLVQQMTAPDPAERDGSPDSQNGSMHASTGSEGLEEALSRDLKINGEKTDPSEDKNKKKEDTDSKDRTKIDKKSKKKEDKTIGKNGKCHGIKF